MSAIECTRLASIAAGGGLAGQPGIHPARDPDDGQALPGARPEPAGVAAYVAGARRPRPDHRARCPGATAPSRSHSISSTARSTCSPVTDRSDASRSAGASASTTSGRTYRGALDGLGVEARMSDKPQELEDPTPFSRDHRERTYDAPVGGVVVRGPDHDPPRVRRVALAVLRSHRPRVLVGRLRHDGHALQWSSRDASSGRRASSGATTLTRSRSSSGSGPAMRARRRCSTPTSFPSHPGCSGLPFDVPAAGWVGEMGEWVLPYEAVRTSPDPRAPCWRSWTPCIPRPEAWRVGTSMPITTTRRRGSFGPTSAASSPPTITDHGS